MTVTPTAPNTDESRAWYALYTRPRFEKKVEKELLDLDIEAFLPLVTVTKFWSDRKKKVIEPLFPSYLFVNANRRERYDSLQPTGVVRMVSFNGAPVRIPEEQVQAVRRILDCGYVPVVQQLLGRGSAVEIVAGPLAGLCGVVNERRGSFHFSIFIDGIRQSVAVNIDAKLKPLEKQKLNSSHLRRLASL